MTYDVRNPGPGLGQAQKCGRLIERVTEEVQRIIKVHNMVKTLFFNVIVSNIRHFSSIISTTKMRVRNLRTNDSK